MVRVTKEMVIFGVALIIGFAGNIVATWAWEQFTDQRIVLIGVSLAIFLGALYMIFFKGLEFIDRT